jgi:hypothetical protein
MRSALSPIAESPEPSRNLEIRGSTLCWQLSPRVWLCSDLELGPSMLAPMDGSVSRSETGKASSSQP